MRPSSRPVAGIVFKELESQHKYAVLSLNKADGSFCSIHQSNLQGTCEFIIGGEPILHLTNHQKDPRETLDLDVAFSCRLNLAHL